MHAWPDLSFIPRQADWPERNLYQEAEGGVSLQHHLEGERNCQDQTAEMVLLEFSIRLIHFIHSIIGDIHSTSVFAQETEGVKPKKAGKMKNRRNGGRQQTSQGQGGEYKVCSIEGTRASIDKCLDIVKQK